MESKNRTLVAHVDEVVYLKVLNCAKGENRSLSNYLKILILKEIQNGKES